MLFVLSLAEQVPLQVSELLLQIPSDWKKPDALISKQLCIRLWQKGKVVLIFIVICVENTIILSQINCRSTQSSCNKLKMSGYFHLCDFIPTETLFRMC